MHVMSGVPPEAKPTATFVRLVDGACGLDQSMRTFSGCGVEKCTITLMVKRSVLTVFTKA